MTPATPKILIVDDDQAIRDVLTEALEDRFTVVCAAEAAAAFFQLSAERPDLILLDLVLPGMDGLVLLERIRRLSAVPVIVLSARHAQADRVLSRNLGADDFLSKPFDLDELDARIDAVLRRAARVPITTPPPTPQPDAPLTVGSLTLDGESGDVRIGGAALHLTPTEHKLLTQFAAHPEKVLSQSVLGQEVWGVADAGICHLVDVHVSRLRARLRTKVGAPEIITIRARGFLMQAAL